MRARVLSSLASEDGDHHRKWATPTPAKRFRPVECGVHEALCKEYSTHSDLLLGDAYGEEMRRHGRYHFLRTTSQSTSNEKTFMRRGCGWDEEKIKNSLQLIADIHRSLKQVDMMELKQGTGGSFDDKSVHISK